MLYIIFLPDFYVYCEFQEFAKIVICSLVSTISSPSTGATFFILPMLCSFFINKQTKNILWIFFSHKTADLRGCIVIPRVLIECIFLFYLGINPVSATQYKSSVVGSFETSQSFRRSGVLAIWMEMMLQTGGMKRTNCCCIERFISSL